MPSPDDKLPPRNFDCPYQHNCPHLQGLSTKWVFEEYQNSYNEHIDHWAVRDIQQEELEKAAEYIGQLEKENERLRASKMGVEWGFCFVHCSPLTVQRKKYLHNLQRIL